MTNIYVEECFENSPTRPLYFHTWRVVEYASHRCYLTAYLYMLDQDRWVAVVVGFWIPRLVILVITSLTLLRHIQYTHIHRSDISDHYHGTTP